MSKPVIDLWANFLFNEKLDPNQLDPKDTLRLLELCQRLAQIRPPKINPHKSKLESRALVCETAIDMGFDLMTIKRLKNGVSKVAMGRGLLDVWNEVYKKRFGSTLGTSGESEVTRRKIVTNLLKDIKPST